MNRSPVVLALTAMLALSGAAGAAGPDDPTRPALSDLMAMTQLRHFKLWYSERVENWPLADYELRQMRGVLARMAKLYPDAAASAGAVRFGEQTGPILEDIQGAIEEKNGRRFESAFGRLTEACNTCHQASDVSFIAIQVPKRSPFSNQKFPPGKP
jgi:hypothetical protein